MGSVILPHLRAIIDNKIDPRIKVTMLTLDPPSYQVQFDGRSIAKDSSLVRTMNLADAFRWWMSTEDMGSR